MATLHRDSTGATYVLGLLALIAVAGTTHGAAGRITGLADVTRTGAFTYQIPIWAPPGPLGIQPNVAIVYNSTVGEGDALVGTSNPDSVSLGPGWVLSGLSMIHRCSRTAAQDGPNVPGGPFFVPSDAYCLNGKRLRLTSASSTYGLDGSTYATEIADFSLITAHGTTGYGPTHFIVKGKDGLTYEFGNSNDSRILLPNSGGNLRVRAWLLNKVSRAAAHYSITYGPGESGSVGVGVPTRISWSPTSSSSSTYQYTMDFTYALRGAAEGIAGYASGEQLINTNLLSAITVRSSDTVTRHYRFTYATSSTTQRSRLQNVQECADEALSDCLLPTTMTYVQGALGVSDTVGTALSGVTALIGTYDFNSDGRSDILYDAGGTLYVSFSTGSGFGAGVSTGLAITSTDRYYVADLVGSGRPDILITRSGVWWRYYWTGSSFTGVSTGTPINLTSDGPNHMELADHNGDGLPDLISMTTRRTSPDPSSHYYEGTIHVRHNTSSQGNLSFSATETTYLVPGCNMSVGCVPFVMAPRPWSQPRDLNADGRTDLLIGVQDIGFNQVVTHHYSLLSNGTTYDTTYAASSYLNGIGYVKWNDDRCADVVTSVNGSGTIVLAACNGSVAQSLSFSGEPVGVTDWNLDGRTDLLVKNGSILSVYLSTGRGISSRIDTALSVADRVIPAEVNGDGLIDVLIASGSAPYTVTYRLHNDIGALPDHLSAVTDGYGVTKNIAYVSIAAGHYTKGTGALDPEEDWIGPYWVVKTLTRSDGIAGNYTQTFWYTGARKSRLRGFEGFQMRQVTDSRTGQVRKTYYDLLFPNTGMVRTDELFQAENEPLISRTELENTWLTLDGTAGHQQYFPYASMATTETYEVGGDKDGRHITSKGIEFSTPDNYGNFASITETVTDRNTGSPFANQTWTTTTTTSYSPNTGNWCVGQPTGVTIEQTAPGQPMIRRTLSYGVDYSKCRRESEVIEPGNATYELTRTFGFDAFGNIESEAVSGAGITSRTTRIHWGATGQFPETITDPLGSAAGYRVLRGYDYAKSVLTSEVIESSDGAVQNAPASSWQHDNFARLTRETRPDRTATSWEYTDCTSGCFNSNHHVTVTQRDLDTNGVAITDQITYLDRFERPLVARQRILDGSYSQIERQYDSLGRVDRQSMPCDAASCALYWTTTTYDDLNRPTEVSRPIKESNPAVQSTKIAYLGRTTIMTDAEGKTTTKLVDVAGNLRSSQDHTGYYQSFTYDSFGSLTTVTDSASRPLFFATYDYGLGAFQRTRTDRSFGAGTATYNALGELIGYIDAKSQSFAIAYDALSRPLTRRDGITGPTTQETITTWAWGQSPGLHNVGQLQNVSIQSADGTYTEAHRYDSTSRVAYRDITIPSDATHTYDFDYDDATGLLETLTYPTSTSYRLALRYCHQHGYLQKIAEGSCSGTPFWQANEMNPRAQITNETLGNGVTTQRTFDAVTSWVSNVISGVSGNPASVQNESYLFDRVGNVLQRQNNALGLTENFHYDDLHRLDYTTLTNGSGTSTNLDLSYYDALGHIQTKVEAGDTSPPIGQDITWTSYNYPKLITATVPNAGTQTARFAYGADRQRWRMEYTSGGVTETTHYLGGLMEKVTLGSAVDYRHYIYAGGKLAAIYSRQSSGTNTLRYVLEDHQGSVASLLNGASVVNESFTAYGNRRDAATWSGAPTSSDLSTMNGITRRGYTGHTALGTMGLSHMNGRVQDAITGTFLSPDPFITQPGNTQNFNRYAYAYNNPLTFIDPSGFSLVCWMPPVSYGGTYITIVNGVPVEGVFTEAAREQCIQMPEFPMPNLPTGGGGSGGGGPTSLQPGGPRLEPMPVKEKAPDPGNCGDVKVHQVQLALGAGGKFFDHGRDASGGLGANSAGQLFWKGTASRATEGYGVLASAGLELQFELSTSILPPGMHENFEQGTYWEFHADFLVGGGIRVERTSGSESISIGLRPEVGIGLYLGEGTTEGSVMATDPTLCKP